MSRKRSRNDEHCGRLIVGTLAVTLDTASGCCTAPDVCSVLDAVDGCGLLLHERLALYEGWLRACKLGKGMKNIVVANLGLLLAPPPGSGGAPAFHSLPLNVIRPARAAAQGRAPEWGSGAGAHVWQPPPPPPAAAHESGDEFVIFKGARKNKHSEEVLCDVISTDPTVTARALDALPTQPGSAVLPTVILDLFTTQEVCLACQGRLHELQVKGSPFLTLLSSALVARGLRDSSSSPLALLVRASCRTPCSDKFHMGKRWLPIVQPSITRSSGDESPCDDGTDVGAVLDLGRPHEYTLLHLPPHGVSVTGVDAGHFGYKADLRGDKDVIQALFGGFLLGGPREARTDAAAGPAGLDAEAEAVDPLEEEAAGEQAEEGPSTVDSTARARASAREWAAKHRGVAGTHVSIRLQTGFTNACTGSGAITLNGLRAAAAEASAADATAGQRRAVLWSPGAHTKLGDLVSVDLDGEAGSRALLWGMTS
jgi:hypothetical protein